MLVYDLHGDESILQYVSDSCRLNNGYAAFPASLYNCQLAKAFRLPVIPPVDYGGYKYPIHPPFRPREHQRVMANFMALHPRCFNLSDMGTMKTLATLWAADFVMEQNPGWRTLLVCPVSIMQRVWGDAITQHFLGKRTYEIVYGDAKRRQAILRKPADFYIVNFDGVGVGAKFTASGPKRTKLTLEGLSRDIAERKDIAIVAVDEASAYRTGNTRRHRVARAVLVPKPYIWCLTGTPTPQGPEGAHGLARLVNPNLQESFTQYKKRVMFQVGMYKWVPKQGAHLEAMKLLQPSIRYEMRDCVDVPPCTEQQRDVELTAQQKAMVKELQKELAIELGDGKVITAAHQAALRMKLIQISCGAVYDQHHNVTRLDCAPRLNELEEIIIEAGRKIVIFTPLTSLVNMVYDHLKDKYSCAVINGPVPIKQRNQIIQAFQNDKDPHILICDPGTMSHGVDLFAASVCVWYGATDRTELYLQANRRIDRPGQTVATTVVQLAASGIEREMFRRCAENRSMQGLILDLIKGG
jgi:SNF2 family DNA or RNA helicase